MKKSLNFNWTFKNNFEEKDLSGFTGETVDLPHSHAYVPHSYFSQDITRLSSSYYKNLTINPNENKRYFLYFEGVMSKAFIHVNQVLVGTHIGGFTAFSFEITEVIKDGLNDIHVRVDAHEENDHPPFGNVVDYLTFGGIYREVFLIERPLDFIEHLLIDGNQELLNFQIIGNAQTSNPHHIEIDILNHQQNLKRISFTKSLNETFKHTEVHDLKIWSIENPQLYHARISIDGEYFDTIRFGIRTIKVTKDAFYLNDKPIFLRGLNRHQAYPYTGFAMPKSAQILDADLLKETLACNIVRSSHYPPSKHFLNRCDEIGLLVFTELPGWQHIGDLSWKEIALKNLQALTLEGYNHPSIVMIGTRINESVDDNSFYTKTRDLVKQIDATRPTGGVRFLSKSHLLEDVYTFNDFSHRGNNPGLTPKKLVTHLKNPYLITEYNGHMFPTKSFDDEKKRVEHAKRHFQVLNDAYKMKGLMGAIGWVMNDYNTHKDFGSNNHICYHGVLDMNRNLKYAGFVYASLGEKPFMEVLSMMHIGELAGSELKEIIVATNVDSINLYKNDQFIGNYQRDKKTYPHLPYSPIIITDLIGQAIHQNEIFKPKDATRIKNILLKTLRKGLKMSLLTKLQMGYILFKYKLSYIDAVNLYTRYIGGWGEDSKHYRFEGIKNNEVVVVQEKGQNDDYKLNIVPQKTKLSVEDTYDVSRITVELINAYKERAFYTDLVIDIEVSGQVELMGPSKRVLQGGITSFWIKASQAGSGKVMIHSDRFETNTLTFTIHKS